jgi:hypothetical protein
LTTQAVGEQVTGINHAPIPVTCKRSAQPPRTCRLTPHLLNADYIRGRAVCEGGLIPGAHEACLSLDIAVMAVYIVSTPEV